MNNPGFVTEAAIAGLFVWVAVAARLPYVLPRLTILHGSVILATAMTMLGLCVAVIASFGLDWPREVVRLIVTYVLGMQLVAGIAAVAMLYRYNGRGILRHSDQQSQRRRGDPQATGRKGS